MARSPIPTETAVRSAAGAISGNVASLRCDRHLQQTLSAREIDSFVDALTATRLRDKAIVWLMKNSGLRISEVLALRLGDIDWSTRALTVRASKSRTARIVPAIADTMAILAAYVREERPPTLPHDVVFVNLGHRGRGQPFTYRAWVAVCEQTRQVADTPRVHAHAFRHTFATNMAEAGLPLDTLQRVLGHRQVETTMVYNAVRDGRTYCEYQEAMAVRRATRLAYPGSDAEATP